MIDVIDVVHFDSKVVFNSDLDKFMKQDGDWYMVGNRGWTRIDGDCAVYEKMLSEQYNENGPIYD